MYNFKVLKSKSLEPVHCYQQGITFDLPLKTTQDILAVAVRQVAGRVTAVLCQGQLAVLFPTLTHTASEGVPTPTEKGDGALLRSDSPGKMQS